jgi:hypothetical protein
MSEISEIEIKSMTKEQNYIRGYEDGKSDVLDKVREEVLRHSSYNGFELSVGFKDGYIAAMANVLMFIDKCRAESEVSDADSN